MSSEYLSKDLSHHGIVSVVCDQIGLVETIDQIIPPDSRAEMTVGEALKLMIINGLGFSSRPLYLEAQFFESKPIERLLGRKLKSDQISDDRLGRSLDHCFKNGCNKIFSSIATKAALQFNVDQKFRHLDTTSMNVNGQYNQEEKLGLVQFGYSKDHRPDLKQFMISLVSSKDGDVPLLAQTVAGNTSDKTHFQETLNALKDQIDPNEPTYYVADSALYTDKTLQDVSNQMKWITRVPEVIKPVKTLITQIPLQSMLEIGNGYRIAEVCSLYGGVRQRWLIVFSQQARDREAKTLEKRVIKELTEKKKELKKISAKRFSCDKDASAAIAEFEKKLKYHECANITVTKKHFKQGRGRPKKDAILDSVYLVSASIERDESRVNRVLAGKGKFVIATNELDETKLPSVELLEAYKGQQCVERGFRFLKDPLFMSSSVFLKNEERIVALGMVMCLCLLVYSIAQRLLRLRIQESKTTVPNQRGQPTTKPTLRWIFQVFEGVHVLFHMKENSVQELVLNLNPERMRILELLGPPFQKIYGNAP